MNPERFETSEDKGPCLYRWKDLVTLCGADDWIPETAEWKDIPLAEVNDEKHYAIFASGQVDGISMLLLFNSGLPGML